MGTPRQNRNFIAPPPDGLLAISLLPFAPPRGPASSRPSSGACLLPQRVAGETPGLLGGIEYTRILCIFADVLDASFLADVLEASFDPYYAVLLLSLIPIGRLRLLIWISPTPDRRTGLEPL
jgi:hypothetical protein